MATEEAQTQGGARHVGCLLSFTSTATSLAKVNDTGGGQSIPDRCNSLQPPWNAKKPAWRKLRRVLASWQSPRTGLEETQGQGFIDWQGRSNTEINGEKCAKKKH